MARTKQATQEVNSRQVENSSAATNGQALDGWGQFEGDENASAPLLRQQSPHSCGSTDFTGAGALENFPTHVLPEPVRNYIDAAAIAIGCDQSFVALPLLVSLARAVGSSRVIRLKRDWTEPAVIWGAIVGRSGTHKSPGMRSALKFIKHKAKHAIEEHREALERFEEALAIYEKDFAIWKGSKKKEKPPQKPAEPVCNRYTTSNATIEALVDLLNDQPDGILVISDELKGWLDGIGEYKKRGVRQGPLAILLGRRRPDV